MKEAAVLFDVLQKSATFVGFSSFASNLTVDFDFFSG
jgi:hypothetical protein